MDTQWRRLQPLLPSEKPWTGRPNMDRRRILNGISCVHRTGALWRNLPHHYGPVGTVSSRFYRWRAAGIRDQVLIALQTEADAQGQVDRDLHFVDATVIRAHQHAAGACRDKGYSSPTARTRLRRRHIRLVIPSKSNQRHHPRFGREAYEQRNRIERLINHLKQFRRVATRYEKRGINYLAMVMLGMILLWL